jgi:hypothetical protein
MSVTAPSALSVRRLSKLVDELGALNAQISLLTRKADECKKTLKASGYDEVLGQSFRAVIVTKTTARIDTAAARGFLTPYQLDVCTKESTSTSISLYDL